MWPPPVGSRLWKVELFIEMTVAFLIIGPYIVVRSVFDREWRDGGP